MLSDGGSSHVQGYVPDDRLVRGGVRGARQGYEVWKKEYKLCSV